jgi:hypothetical protein
VGGRDAADLCIVVSGAEFYAVGAVRAPPLCLHMYQILRGLYMDPPTISRYPRAAEDQIQVRSSIRLLTAGARGLRALMPSALARLIDGSASQAPDHGRIWASRSDLLPHHLHGLASCRRVPWDDASFMTACALGSSECCRTIDLIRPQQDPCHSCVLLGQGHDGTIPAPPLQQRPRPLAAAVTLPIHPPQTTPGPVYQ